MVAPSAKNNMAPLVFRLMSSSLLLLTAAAQLESPPTIFNGPQPVTSYVHADMSATMLPCYASGFPTPSFKWYVDGREIEGQTRAEFELNKGTPEGYYHCRATNKLGTALSNVTRVVKAAQASFAQSTHTTIYKAAIGAKLTISCNNQNPGVPTPRTENYSWKIINENPVSTNQRVQIDESGNLRIAAVTQADFNTNRECRIHNRIMNVDVGGSPSKVENSNEDRVAKTAPEIFFYSNMTNNPGSKSSVVVGLEGRDVYLRCFFSGSDDITYQWKRDDEVNIQYDRFERNNIRSELHITKIQKNDEATYVCSGTNSITTTYFKTKLVVYAAPVFQSTENQPHNVNKSVGDAVEFHCKAYANPPATVQWYKNGVAIDPERAISDPALANFRWSADGETLTISKLCKNNCPSGKEADIMVIQCNASNQFDYAFSNGYINVFDKTRFTTALLEEYVLQEGSTLTLSAHAVSDSQTPVTYRWTRDDVTLYDRSENIRIIQTEDGVTNLTVGNFSSKDVGTYKCVATNDISTDVIQTSVTVFLPEKKADLWPLIVVAIVLMIIFIILAIVCFIYQNRGEDYPVDETERKQGNDPEQDLEDTGFQPFQRKEVVGDGGSTISRNSLERLDKRVDEEKTGLIRDRAGSLGGTFN